MRGAYDKHQYEEEKAHAFEALAKEIERSVSGVSANVIPLYSAA